MDHITPISPIQFDLVSIQGYLSLVTHLHYFVPGSLKIQTKYNVVRIDQLNTEDETDTLLLETKQWLLQRKNLLEPTRRWLPLGEMPYPGYCRAPGSGECIPSLCNCDKLYTIWMNMEKQEHQLSKIK